MDQEKPRSVAVAVLLSVPLPGLGQLYCGRPWAAALFMVLSFAHWAVFILAWAVWRADLAMSLGLWYATFAVVWLAALVHAGLAARRSAGDYRLRSYNLWYFYLLVILVAGAGQFGCYRLVGGHWLASVPLRSDSMTPGLLTGDWLRVDLRPESRAEPERGEVVAAIDPLDGQTWRLLRVVGLPGETIGWSADGWTIDGRAIERQPGQEASYRRRNLQGEWIDQPYLQAREQIGGHRVALALDADPSRRRSGSRRVPPGHLFLVGDNRIHAQDSRAFGPVPLSAVRGVVLKVWFSRDPESGRARPERRGLAVP